MEEALRALLTGYAPLAALVSTRIFWNDIPQGTLGNCVVMHKIAGAPSYTMQGAVNLKGSLVQINTRAAKITDAWAIARAIEGRLSGFRGVQGSVFFGGIFLERDAEQASDKTDPELFRGTRSDYAIWSSTI